jgi:hypothetical protein
MSGQIMTDTMSSDFLVLLLVGGTRVSDSFRLNLTIYCVRKETTVQQMIYDGDTTKQNGHVVKNQGFFNVHAPTGSSIRQSSEENPQLLLK